MRVMCVKTNLIEQDVTTELLNVGYSAHTKFHLKIEKRYNVYAVSFWGSIPVILIEDENGTPLWYPISLFKVIDPEIPNGWSFDILASECTQIPVLGYPDLTTTEGHYDNLIEEEDIAVQIFRRQKSIFYPSSDV